MNVSLIIQKLFGSVTWRMPGTDPALFITFDDGPVREVTPQILDILQSFRVKATFFCTGENVQKHPDVYERILAEDHATGNHTFHHLNGWRTGMKQYVGDIELCSEVMKKSAVGSRQLAVVADEFLSPDFQLKNQSPGSPEKTGTGELPPPNLFRPPYGKITPGQVSRLKSQYSIIMWDVLSRDYNENLTGEECFLNVRNHATGGSIVVFHDSVKAKKRVLYALPKVLEYFSERNFLFRTIA